MVRVAQQPDGDPRLAELRALVDRVDVDDHALCARLAGDLADATFRDGYHLGYVTGVLDVRAAQRGIVRDVGTELDRWRVRCRRHRLDADADPTRCPRCVQRGRDGFGRPHDDDYRGGPVTWRTP